MRKSFMCVALATALVLSNAAAALAWSGHDGRRGHFFGPHGHRVFFGPRVFVGPVFLGPAFYPPVAYYPAPAYAAPVVGYAPPPPPQQYWYYCPDNRLYYPYTQSCPSGWLQVVPSPR